MNSATHAIPLSAATMHMPPSDPIDGLGTRHRTGQRASFSTGRLRRATLAGLVLALHIGSLAILSWVSPAIFTPALEVPIQVALIREAAPSPPAAAPAPPPPVQLPVQAAPPKLQPPPPKPRPQPVAKPAPAKPAEPVPTTTAATAVATEAPAPAVPVSAPAPAATSAATPVTAARFDADYLNNPAPAYPPLSRRMREEGKVVLKVLVSPAGLPARIELSRSSGSERLDRAAELAVSRWKFIAARQGDQAIESWVLVPIIFKLQES